MMNHVVGSKTKHPLPPMTVEKTVIRPDTTPFATKGTQLPREHCPIGGNWYKTLRKSRRTASKVPELSPDAVRRETQEQGSHDQDASDLGGVDLLGNKYTFEFTITPTVFPNNDD